MSIFEIFAVKNTPTYVASKELVASLEKTKELSEAAEKAAEDSKQKKDSN